MKIGSGCEIRGDFPAVLEEVEGFVLEVRARCQCLAGRPDAFAAELLLREALTNAVKHGCRSDPSKRVRCTVRLRPGRLTVAVSDEGAGFDWRTAWQQQARDTADSGRGMEILRRYATRVRFREKGNGLTLWKCW